MLQPLYDKILVLPVEPAKSSTIEIAEERKEPPTRGEVIAVGEGRQDRDGKIHPLKVKKGDIVVFQKYTATAYNDRGTEVFFIGESDCLAIDEPE